MIDINLFILSVDYHLDIYYHNRKINYFYILKKFLLSIRYLICVPSISYKNLYLADDINIVILSTNKFQFKKIQNLSSALNNSNINYFNLIADKNFHRILDRKDILTILKFLIKFIRYSGKISYALCDGIVHIMNYFAILKFIEKNPNNNFKLVITLDPVSQFNRCAILLFSRLVKSEILCFHYGFPTSNSKDYNFTENNIITYVTYSKKYKDIIDLKLNINSSLVVGDVYTRK
jgi:hypothetical protein